MESPRISNIKSGNRRKIQFLKTMDYHKQAVYRPDNIVLQSALSYVPANLTQLAIFVIRFSGEELLMAGGRPLAFNSKFVAYL